MISNYLPSDVIYYSYRWFIAVPLTSLGVLSYWDCWLIVRNQLEILVLVFSYDFFQQRNEVLVLCPFYPLTITQFISQYILIMVNQTYICQTIWNYIHCDRELDPYCQPLIHKTTKIFFQCLSLGQQLTSISTICIYNLLIIFLNCIVYKMVMSKIMSESVLFGRINRPKPKDEEETKENQQIFTSKLKSENVYS